MRKKHYVMALFFARETLYPPLDKKNTRNKAKSSLM